MSDLENPLTNSAQGQLIGGYRVVRELGRGAMGVVYLGVDGAQRQVAIKFLLDHDPHAQQRFAIEGRACQRLDHPNVVRVLDVGDSGGRPFVIMELIEGETLQALLKRGGAFEPERAARIAAQVARALDHAHQRGVIHRDLKPDNVHLSGERAVLADFGLARDAETEAERLTRTGDVMGTPEFMAPEQADGGGKHVDGRTDVYSLGATLYALLAGAPPFKGTSVINTLRQVLMEPPPAPSAKRPGVPVALDRICQRCMAKEPDGRYATAGAVAAELEAFLAQASAQGGLPGWVLGLGGVALAFGGVLVALNLRGSEPGPPIVEDFPSAQELLDHRVHLLGVLLEQRQFEALLKEEPEPKAPRLLMLRAEALIELYRMNEAREALEGVTATDDAALSVLRAWAGVPGAIDDALAAVRAAPEEQQAELVPQLAFVLGVRQDDRDLELSRMAVERFPQNALSQAAAGIAARRHAGPGEQPGMKAEAGTREAEAYFERALALDADCFPARYYLVYTHLDRFRWADAQRVAFELVQAFPHEPNAHFMEGWVFKEQGEQAREATTRATLFRQAILRFSEAVERSYSPYRACLERGYARFQLWMVTRDPDDLAQAETDMLRAIDVADSSHARNALALLYSSSERIELAIESYTIAIDKEPEDVRHYGALLAVLKRERRGAEYRAVLERGTQNLPSPYREDFEDALRRLR